MPIPAILATVGGAVVSGLLQGVTGSSTESATASSTLGKDEFLRLLVAQLKNQDPLNPMDNSQFVAQTAQFSSLEQFQNMNKTLDKLAAAQSGNGGAVGASALLGKTVTVNGSPLALDGTRSATLAYALPTAANSVAIRVFDASGTAVRTMVVGQQGGGTHQAAFDGLDDNGRRLSAGAYTLSSGRRRCDWARRFRRLYRRRAGHGHQRRGEHGHADAGKSARPAHARW